MSVEDDYFCSLDWTHDELVEMGCPTGTIADAVDSAGDLLMSIVGFAIVAVIAVIILLGIGVTAHDWWAARTARRLSTTEPGGLPHGKAPQHHRQ